MTKSTGSQVIHQHIYYIHHEHQTNSSTSDLSHKVISDKINKWKSHIPISQVTLFTKLIVQQGLAAWFSWCQEHE